MTSHGWFDVTEYADLGIYVIAEPGHFEDVKSFLVIGDEKVGVLDTGMGFGNFKALTDSLTGKDPIVLLSHAHFDHIGDAHKYHQVLVHSAEADDLRAGYPAERMRRWFEPQYLRDLPLPEGTDPASAFIPGCEPAGFLNEGEVIDLGGRELEVYHTPGHSPGGITLVDRKHRLMFPGDAIYAAPMYAYAENSDPVAYRDSLRKLAKLADDVDLVFSSHNESPLKPGAVKAMHQAYEEIWAGRTPDERQPDRDIFIFDGFQFWLKPGGYGEGA